MECLEDGPPAGVPMTLAPLLLGCAMLLLLLLLLSGVGAWVLYLLGGWITTGLRRLWT